MRKKLIRDVTQPDSHSPVQLVNMLRAFTDAPSILHAYAAFDPIARLFAYVHLHHTIRCGLNDL